MSYVKSGGRHGGGSLAASARPAVPTNAISRDCLHLFYGADSHKCGISKMFEPFGC